MKPVKKFPVLLIVSVVLCALGYVLRPLMPGLADMFRHLGFIWIGYGVFALLLKLPKETRARTVCSLTRSILSYTAVLLSVFFGLRARRGRDGLARKRRRCDAHHRLRRAVAH